MTRYAIIKWIGRWEFVGYPIYPTARTYETHEAALRAFWCSEGFSLYRYAWEEETGLDWWDWAGNNPPTSWDTEKMPESLELPPDVRIIEIQMPTEAPPPSPM